MDLCQILWDIGIIKFNDNGPRLITKPPLRKEPQLCPADTHQRRNSANAATPKGFTAARTNHQRTAAHLLASPNAPPNPTTRQNHEQVHSPLPGPRSRRGGHSGGTCLSFARGKERRSKDTGHACAAGRMKLLVRWPWCSGPQANSPSRAKRACAWEY